MNGSQMETMLRHTLRNHAAGAPAGPDRAAVLGHARTIRRHRRQGLAALTAAAVAAVVVPVSLALNQGEGPVPGPAGHGHSPEPTPTQTAAPAPRYGSLDSIPRGKDAAVTYLTLDGTVHSPGGTSKLPGTPADVSTFSVYHGGWLVEDQRPGITQYDNSGQIVRTGKGGSIALSADQMQTAFQIGRTVRMGIASGMSNGEQAWQVPASSTLIGILPNGPVITDPNGHASILTNAGAQPMSVPKDVFVTHVGGGQYLAAETGTPAQGNQEGALLDANTGAILWHNEWDPRAFSDDGKYVVATPVVDNGDPSAVAILDAQTGKVIARTPAFKGYHGGWQIAWEGDRAVFTAYASGTREALLSLDLNGNLTRASDVVTVPNGKDGFRFAVQP